ncbi:unnamed protein product [Rangifer tarandus platyrhynchus]|uniref:Uncharacterized protein n=2 Tax=Rangifer tarandus platyrhynchus TaxID=3082113 RepID=A0ABN8YE96_RANTA|nr:unnamed protein product [Rangifer tarandus platyrhynchus]CAI9700207.1 unnamed protein product [Rangifer tarandus platyrhynchus]
MEAGYPPGRKRAGAGGRGEGASQGLGAADQSDTKSVRSEVSHAGRTRDTTEWATSRRSGGHAGHAPRAHTCSEGARARAGVFPRVGTPGLRRAPCLVGGGDAFISQMKQPSIGESNVLAGLAGTRGGGGGGVEETEEQTQAGPCRGEAGAQGPPGPEEEHRSVLPAPQRPGRPSAMAREPVQKDGKEFILKTTEGRLGPSKEGPAGQ